MAYSRYVQVRPQTSSSLRVILTCILVSFAMPLCPSVRLSVCQYRAKLTRLVDSILGSQCRLSNGYHVDNFAAARFCGCLVLGRFPFEELAAYRRLLLLISS